MQSERIAAQRAISLALDTPKGGAQSIGRTSSSPFTGLVPEALPVSSQSFNPHKPPSAPAAPQAIDSKISNKCGTASKKFYYAFCYKFFYTSCCIGCWGAHCYTFHCCLFIRSCKIIKAVHVVPIRSTVPSSCNSVKSSAVTSTAGMMSKSMPTVATTALPSAKPVSSSCSTKPGGQVQGIRHNFTCDETKLKLVSLPLFCGAIGP